MPWISDRLRQPDGCPWDREQTHASLRNHLLEEAYEVYDALEAGATPELAEELGDLLLQVVLHAQLAAEEGVFDLTDVQAAIATKIVRRHPHVFGDAEARTASDVNRQWERIKAASEPRPTPAEAASARRASALDGISRRCRRSPRARRCRSGPRTSATTGRRSTASSTRSPRRPTSSASAGRRRRGGGPRSSATCCSCSSTSRASAAIDAEAALRAANAQVPPAVRAAWSGRRPPRGVALRDLDFEALDALWDAAKAEERRRR